MHTTAALTSQLSPFQVLAPRAGALVPRYLVPIVVDDPAILPGW